jgi:hypothetical protein
MVGRKDSRDNSEAILRGKQVARRFDQKNEWLRYFWYIVLFLISGIAYFSFEAGLLAYLWQADVSKLSFVIMAIFVKSFVKLGVLLHRYPGPTEDDVDSGFEDCDQSMAFGMLGTVIGFIIMTNAFAGVAIDDIQNIKQLFTIATHGMSTALLTTAAGLISSIILRTFYYLTGRRI